MKSKITLMEIPSNSIKNADRVVSIETWSKQPMCLGVFFSFGFVVRIPEKAIRNKNFMYEPRDLQVSFVERIVVLVRAISFAHDIIDRAQMFFSIWNIYFIFGEICISDRVYMMDGGSVAN